MEKLRIGTRKSPLALWQAEHIQQQLETKGIQSELVLIETTGDMILQVAIGKIGSKGVFTEQLEEKLTLGEIDIAVHSAKDMPSRLPEGFEILAFSERELVNDVILSDNPVDLHSSMVIGTSSTRRIASLKHFFPQVQTVDIRGNLQTRIQKMRSGHCDALLLAYAGVHRMGFAPMIRETLSTNTFIPAVGQGSLAIECHRSLENQTKEKIKQALNHSLTERHLLAERTFLRILEGGCSIPVFALCTGKAKDLIIKGGIIRLDGKHRIEREVRGNDPERIGEELAHLILKAGGSEILHEIKKTL